MERFGVSVIAYTQLKMAETVGEGKQHFYMYICRCKCVWSLIIILSYIIYNPIKPLVKMALKLTQEKQHVGFFYVS